MDGQRITTRQFEEEGYAVLRGFLPAKVVAEVQSELERWVDERASELVERGELDELYADEPFEFRLARL